MSSQPSLIDMPDLVMNRILGTCDFQTILILRRVCHGFKDFIDDSFKSEFNFPSIRISVQPNRMNILHDQIGDVEYRKDEKGGCWVKYWISGVLQNKKLLEDVDFEGIFLKDLEIILRFRNPKSILNLRKLSVNLEDIEILEKLKKVLEYQKLSTATEEVVFFKKDDVSPILSFLDCGLFSQILKISLEIQSVFPRDLVMVKEAFFRSTIFKHLRIDYKNFEDSDQLTEFFGESYKDNGYLFDDRDKLKRHYYQSNRIIVYQWFFRIPNCDKILNVYQQNSTHLALFKSYIEFSFMEKSRVPDNAVIQ